MQVIEDKREEINRKYRREEREEIGEIGERKESTKVRSLILRAGRYIHKTPPINNRNRIPPSSPHSNLKIDSQTNQKRVCEEIIILLRLKDVETRNETLVVAAEAVANNASAANEIAAVPQSVEANDAASAVVVAETPYRETITVCNAEIFPSQEEGVGATIALTFKEEIDGYRVNRESRAKEFTKVKRVSFFLSEVIRTMSQNFIVASWLKSKKKDELNELLPVVLMGSKNVVESFHNKAEMKVYRDLISIELEDVFLDTMKTSVLSRI